MWYAHHLMMYHGGVILLNLYNIYTRMPCERVTVGYSSIKVLLYSLEAFRASYLSIYPVPSIFDRVRALKTSFCFK